MLQSSYTIDISRHFYVWFSKKPNECMPVLNKIRLIQAVTRNPNQAFTLVYSASCLNEASQMELQSLADNLGVRLVDFDTSLKRAVDTELDLALHKIASQEIKAAREKAGGNMAAASDCVRIMEPALRDYGNYLDLDVDIDFSTKQITHQVKWPVTLCGGTFYLEGAPVPIVNNHYVAAARDAHNDLHPHAIEKLNLLKKRIVENYQGLHPEMLVAQFTGELMYSASTAQQLLHNFELAKRDVFQYRMLLKQACPSKLVYDNLYKNTVACVSGPMVYYFMFEDVIDLIVASTDMTRMKLTNTAKIIDLISDKMALVGYQQNGLQAHIISKDIAENMVEEYDGSNLGKKDDEIIGVKTDLSWTKVGREILDKKSEKVEKGVIALQALFRGHLSRQRQSFNPEQARILQRTRSLTELLQITQHYNTSDPGQALRRAAHGHLPLDLMQRLVRALSEYDPKLLDAQDATPNKHMTALHHALTQGQAERATLLIQAGAQLQIQASNGLTALELFKQSTKASIRHHTQLCEAITASSQDEKKTCGIS